MDVMVVIKSIFMRLTNYKNELGNNTDIMHLTCKCAQRTLCATYSTYALLKADSAGQNVHKLVHDVVPQKRYVVQGTYLFE